MQENTNWYCKQESPQHNIIFPSRTTINPCLDVVRITDVQDTPKTICNSIQEKKVIHRNLICMTDANYEYILDEIE